MKRTLLKAIYILLPLAALLVSCENDDSDLETLRMNSKEKPREIQISSPTFDDADPIPDVTSESYNDFVEGFDAKSVVTINFTANDATITQSGKTITVKKNGAHITLNCDSKTVKIIVSGETSNGSLTINSDVRCHLQLNNAYIKNENGAAVCCNSKKTMYVECVEGTENILQSAGNDSNLPGKACLFSEGQMCFSGKGYLLVYSDYKSGIASDDYIFIRPNTQIDVTCGTGHGLKAKDGIFINGGNLIVSTIFGGTKGLNCDTDIKINGGNIAIINNGSSRIDQITTDSGELANDTVSSAGIKTDTAFEMNGGYVQVYCSANDAKGIKTTGDFTMNGGKLYVVTMGDNVLASPKGIKSDSNITFNGGYSYIYSNNSLPLDADGKINVKEYKKQKSYLVEI